MCNAYYIIITVELRQAFFEDFFIFSESTRYCTFLYFSTYNTHFPCYIDIFLSFLFKIA